MDIGQLSRGYSLLRVQWRHGYRQETLEYHYGKHHKAYVDNLNKLIPGTEFDGLNLEEIIQKHESHQESYFWSTYSEAEIDLIIPQKDSFIGFETPPLGLSLGSTVQLQLELAPEKGVVALPSEALYGNDMVSKVVQQRMTMIKVDRVGEKQLKNGRLVLIC